MICCTRRTWESRTTLSFGIRRRRVPERFEHADREDVGRLGGVEIDRVRPRGEAIAKGYAGDACTLRA